MRKHYERILHDSESRVQRYLDIQILDENSPFCGGFPKADSLAEPKTAIYRATTMTACYLNPESRYYLDAELGRRLPRPEALPAPSLPGPVPLDPGRVRG